MLRRRGITGVETVIIFVAAILTVAAFSFIVVTLGFRSPEERQPIENDVSLPVNATLPELLANITDPEFMEFYDYVFGTWERISGVFDADFTSLRTASQ